MAIKKQIKHGAIQKVCHLLNGVFHPIQRCHTSRCQFSSFTSPVLFTKLHEEIIGSEKEDLWHI